VPLLKDGYVVISVCFDLEKRNLVSFEKVGSINIKAYDNRGKSGDSTINIGIGMDWDYNPVPTSPPAPTSTPTPILTIIPSITPI